MKKKTPNKIRFIVILMIVVWIAMIFSQLDFLQLNIDNQKSLFETKVETALHRATTDINFKTFEQLQLENPELKNEKMNFSDTTSIYVEFANELQIEKWDKFTVNDFINLHNMVKAMNINFDYLNLGFPAIDSIIKDCLNKENIHYPCEIGVYSYGSKKFIYASSEAYLTNLENSSIRHKIISLESDGSKRLDELVLFFPKINLKLWIHNFSYHFYLIFILIVVLFCFISTISIIRQQDEVSNLKTNFVNSMTHEIKTPVATISLACQALQDESIQKDKAMISTYLNVISEENDRIKQLVEEVLNLVRVGDKKIPNPIDININKVMENVARMHELPAKEKNGEIILQLDAANDLIAGDKIHIGNAISNLIDNALKYGGKNPTVTITTKNAENSIVISVKDNGIGIRKIDQHKVFDEFFRVDTGNIHDVKGHGLGLNYVKHVAEFHGGSIDVKSEFHHGSTFILTLPLKN